jgi:hypothetical protein
MSDNSTQVLIAIVHYVPWPLVVLVAATMFRVQLRVLIEALADLVRRQISLVTPNIAVQIQQMPTASLEPLEPKVKYFLQLMDDDE